MDAADCDEPPVAEQTAAVGEAVHLVAWIDFLDPWSYVVSSRLDRLEREFGDRVFVQYRGFMTVTEPVTKSPAEYRAEVVDWKDPDSQEPSLVFSLWDTDARPPTHSAPALAAARVAAAVDPERADEFRRGVFAAHFTDNRTISDSGVLISLARDAGLDADLFAMALRGNYADYVDQVIADHGEAVRKGIESTPGLVADDAYLVKGHPSYLSLHTLIERLLGEREGASSEPESATDDSADRPETEPEPGSATDDPADDPEPGSGGPTAVPTGRETRPS